MIKEINIPSGWREIKLGEVFLFLRTSSYSRCQTSKASKNALYIHYGDIHKINNLTLDFKQENILRLNDDIDSSSLDFLQNGDLIVADASEDYLGIGSCSEIKNLNERAVSGLHTFALRPNINFIKTGFSSLLLNSFFVKNYLKKIATGASVLGISKYYLARTPLILPPLQEQKAIADILEKWDEAIEKTSKLIAEKKKRFEWLLGGSIKAQEDWRRSSIGNCFILGRGRVISKKDLQENPGNYPVFSSQTSNNGEFGKLNSFDFEGDYITWTTDGAHAGMVFFRTGKFNCTNVCGSAKPKYPQEISAEFISYFLQGKTKKYVSYVGNPKLMNGIFSKIPISYPSLQRQHEIAKTLNTAKKEITILEEILAKYKNQKKGLMQKLLTGKIRVNNIN